MTAMHSLPSDWTVPEVTAFSRAWLSTGEIVVQRCVSCATLQHPPEEICHACGGMEFDGQVLVPTGTIYSFTIVHHAVAGALAEAVPYAIVLVSLDGAPQLRVVGNLVGATADLITIGRPVIAHWEQRGDVLLPQWALA